MIDRKLHLALLVAGSLALSGCAASLAATALSMAMRSAQKQPQSNAHLKPAATQACSAHAAQYGGVQIIDVVQRGVSRIVVWGTATNGQERQSFECTYTTKIVGFRLRPIRT
jgi:hypothetical protein